MYSVITKIRSGWSKFRDLIPLLANRALPLGAKGRLYSACVRSIMLFGSEAWLVKVEDVIRVKTNDARMVRRTCNPRPKGRISAENVGLD